MRRNKYEAYPTARFWVFWNQDWVKLSLKIRPSCRYCRGWLNQETTSRGPQKVKCIECDREQEAVFLNRFTHSKSWDNGEGYSWESDAYEYVYYSRTMEHPYILCEWGHGGTDCDGRQSTSGSSTCLYDEMFLVPAGMDEPRDFFNGHHIHRPLWHKQSSTHYDQFAQMMNY